MHFKLPDSEQHRYRFGGVELDGANRLLRVDGRIRTCSHKTIDLLLLLCTHPGTLIERTALIEALWPGGQLVTQETLTKLIFKTRNLLGPYGKHIRTIRGLGLRLDASVEVLDRTDNAFAPAPAPQGDPQTRQRRISPYRILLAASFAVVLLLLLILIDPFSDPSWLNEGYALNAADIHAQQPDTADLLQEAFRNDNNGERERASALLEAIHRNDQSTPVPALFLALWNGAGARAKEPGELWLDEARQRMQPWSDVYLNLLHDYIAAEIHGNPELIISQAGALLGARPQAWRLRLARAHVMEFLGMREAALKEIQQIHVTRFGDRKFNQTIADRASFGDVEGAQAILDAIPAESDPVTHAFLSGRIAWSRGDFPAAADHFRRASKLAHDVARLDLFRRCLIYVAAIEAMQGQYESAIETATRARTASGDASLIDEIDLSLILAQLNSELGQQEEMRLELDKALRGASHTSAQEIGLASYFATWRLNPDAIGEMPADITPGAAALWQGMKSFTGGDQDAARSHLAESIILGIGNTRLADEARWLQLQLGMPVMPATVLDPPYPPLSRVVLRRQISTVLEETEFQSSTQQAGAPATFFRTHE